MREGIKEGRKEKEGYSSQDRGVGRRGLEIIGRKASRIGRGCKTL